jgi:hypothetical protein
MDDTEESIVHSPRSVRKNAPCPKCGFTRTVKVSCTQQVKITYRVTVRPGRLMPDREEISRENYGPPGKEYVPFCTACDYILRAGVHEAAARKYKAKAMEILKNREKRKERLHLKRTVEVRDVPASDGPEG